VVAAGKSGWVSGREAAGMGERGAIHRKKMVDSTVKMIAAREKVKGEGRSALSQHRLHWKNRDEK